jgi:predicted AlkP superfamily phosphohydrolase/phosphomutase
VLVVIDGTRSDAIVQANTPYLDRMMGAGAYTLTAQSLMPTITLPCHMSIFYSVPATRHGILSNDYHPPVHPLTGLYDQIKAKSKCSATHYGWDTLRDTAPMVAHLPQIERPRD